MVELKDLDHLKLFFSARKIIHWKDLHDFYVFYMENYTLERFTLFYSYFCKDQFSHLCITMKYLYFILILSIIKTRYF